MDLASQSRGAGIPLRVVEYRMLGGKLAVLGDRRWVCERLDSMWVQRKVIEIKDLEIRQL
jgi:hypothetical protein